MLSIAEIVRKTQIDRSALQRYLNEADVREALGGAASHPQYPDESFPLFCRLAELHQRGEVKPKTLAIRLKSEITENRLPVTDYRKPDTDQSLMVMPQQAVALLDQIADAVAHRISAELSPPPEDRLITSQEAADLLACKPRSVKRYVLPVRPGVYKRSAILRYIQSL